MPFETELAGRHSRHRRRHPGGRTRQRGLAHRATLIVEQPGLQARRVGVHRALAAEQPAAVLQDVVGGRCCQLAGGCCPPLRIGGRFAVVGGVEIGLGLERVRVCVGVVVIGVVVIGVGVDVGAYVVAGIGIGIVGTGVGAAAESDNAHAGWALPFTTATVTVTATATATADVDADVDDVVVLFVHVLEAK